MTPILPDDIRELEHRPYPNSVGHLVIDEPRHSLLASSSVEFLAPAVRAVFEGLR